MRWITVVALCVSSVANGADPDIRIEPGKDNAQSKFVLHHLPESVLRESAGWTEERWQELFAVHTLVDGRLASIPMGGEYQVFKGELVFTPRYPLRAGLTYRAVFRTAPGKSAELTRDFTPAPAKELPATRLTAIFPTTDVVPENLLKFYLHFSGPMSRGEVYQRVQLLDRQGQKVEYPFLELAEELWTPDGTRVTLYFDPGRIKRGLKPRELFGPALLEGGSYQLVIDADWPDAAGRPLAGSERKITKAFRVTAPDDRQPDCKHWKLVVPQVGTRGPLTVHFDEPLDSAMLVRVVSVRGAGGKFLAGDVALGPRELSWTFRPQSEWLPGEYQLTAAIVLEDLAGNSLGRPFEVDVFRPATNRFETETAEVPFVVEP